MNFVPNPINTALWDSVFKTNPEYTKAFSRAGGFKGTAISPMYLMHRATETFGPIGIGWGFEERESKMAEGVWFSRVRVWYLYNDKRGEMEQWGATTMINKRQDGSIFVDEEAAKKSVTDAVTKCLSYLGFGADVHMGMYDDNKYVAELKEEKRREKAIEVKLTAEERQAAEAEQKVVAARRIAELQQNTAPATAKPAPTPIAPADPKPPASADKPQPVETPFKKMLKSIRLLRDELESLGALKAYYDELWTVAQVKHANELKTIDQGRAVYRALRARLLAVQAETPQDGESDLGVSHADIVQPAS